MNGKELLDYKQTNLKMVLARESGTWVPSVFSSTFATCAYKNITAVEAMKDPAVYTESMTAIFADMWVDVNSKMGGWFTPDLPDYFQPIQHRFAPDGTTPENIQCLYMNADEYPEMIDDPERFVAQKMLPRKYPQMFSDRVWAETALKKYTEAKAKNASLAMLVTQELKEKYGIITMLDPAESFINPLDHLFDSFRGFKGTLTDLRRQPANVKAAVEKLWEVKCLKHYNTSVKAPYPVALQVPHIPTYLSTKQFEELYWPYEKKEILRLANAGNKAYILLEGQWKRYLPFFREVPKDSCILRVDDDNVYDIYHEIGDYQLICGGVSAMSLRLDPIDKIKDEIKRLIDTCAADHGFLFGTDKSMIAPGDINRNVVDAFNFVYEYSSQH